LKNFALTGVAGFIAPRHLQAIKETGNVLVAAVDPHDSVGILDSYFPDTSFFTEFERFDRHIEKLRREGSAKQVHYVSICSPNHLHDAHIRFALRIGAHAICEKPLVLNPWNLDMLEDIELELNSRVYTILQLRVHPTMIELKRKIDAEQRLKRFKVKLVYITSRGKWYYYSWKGDIKRSGGIATNIGIHFFDILMWLFGSVEECRVYVHQNDKVAGRLTLEKADVEWYLSIDQSDIPESVKKSGQRTYRLITVDDQRIEFSSGFTNLHTSVYEETLSGKGFGIKDARPSIELVHSIRNSSPIDRNNNFLNYILAAME
jgi:UDP-N-acetyl-2-amino-2-deoxyglucuronate dehydrogenase